MEIRSKIITLLELENYDISIKKNAQLRYIFRENCDGKPEFMGCAFLIKC